MTRARRKILVLSQYVSLIVGLVMLGYCAFVVIAMRRYQEQAQGKLERLAQTSSVQISDHTFLEATDRPVTRRVSNKPPPFVGRIEIPRTRLSAIVAEGTSSEVLSVAVGHVEGTALPGESGNIALAAHRDTFFRGLGELQSGDFIRLTIPKGRFDYRVEFTEVVDPADTWILRSGSGQALTLITCYPFHYIGAAPKRFVVRAYRVHAS